ncbi:MAG: TfoX/Sxy family protein [Ignavibacteriae bacterium]|nr:TfoX/Sxy family protein [Ignavibacteriota bacterium]
MFGGIAFMIRGHMSCGIAKRKLMVRVKLDRYPNLLKKPHARKMTFTGKPLKGFLYINPDGYKTQKGLQFWIDQALQFAQSKPLKNPAKQIINFK